MTTTCNVCGKEFAKKAGLQKHAQRKIPCKAPLQLIQTHVARAMADVGLPPAVEEEPSSEFRATSKAFHASLSKEERQNHGIFFTPKKVRDRLFEVLQELGVSPRRVVEPSFGSGEFLFDAQRLYPQAALVGVEQHAGLFAAVQAELVGAPNASLTCGDFLTWQGTADLILGNPPYFVLPAEGKTSRLKGGDKVTPGHTTAKEKKEFTAKHANAMTGRPNIYIMFLYKCLMEHLEEGGFLAFIIPTSIYNCSYYQPMRHTIRQHAVIRHLESLNKPGFYETAQDTTLLVLQKQAGSANDDYFFLARNGGLYLTPYYKELKEMCGGATTLADLGLGVKTGNVVWNQVKDALADDGTLLVYSSNLRGSELVLHNLCGNEKKQYVRGLTKPTQSGPVILVSRGYGNTFRFEAVLVDLVEFYAENHVNVIYPKTAEAAAHLPRVITSFADKRTAQFIQWFVGNGSLSATELETLVPIF